MDKELIQKIDGLNAYCRQFNTGTRPDLSSENLDKLFALRDYAIISTKPHPVLEFPSIAQQAVVNICGRLREAQTRLECEKGVESIIRSQEVVVFYPAYGEDNTWDTSVIKIGAQRVIELL